MEPCFDPETGLIPAVAQDRLTGEIRMLAWMNREALERTLATGLATFYSRSRGKLWVKGETSGNVLRVEQVIADCDADVLLLLVDPVGPTCHTGRESCFFQRVVGGTELEEVEPRRPFLGELERVIESRQASSAQQSYTKSLLEAGAAKIGAKIAEEASELAAALSDESDERVASEAADLLYHLMVALRLRGIRLRSVLEALAARTGQSGHAEKAGRSS